MEVSPNLTSPNIISTNHHPTSRRRPITFPWWASNQPRCQAHPKAVWSSSQTYPKWSCQLTISRKSSPTRMCRRIAEMGPSIPEEGTLQTESMEEDCPLQWEPLGGKILLCMLLTTKGRQPTTKDPEDSLNPCEEGRLFWTLCLRRK